jgi:DNA-binding IclR family transcriptional regulator
MADRKMQLGARLICEFLRKCPGSTRQEIAEGLNQPYKNLRDTVSRLECGGYICREGRYGARFSLTGKAFEPSASYRKTGRRSVQKAQSTASSCQRSELDTAIYNMVRVARSTEAA